MKIKKVRDRQGILWPAMVVFVFLTGHFAQLLPTRAPGQEQTDCLRLAGILKKAAEYGHRLD